MILHLYCQNKYIINQQKKSIKHKNYQVNIKYKNIMHICYKVKT